MRLLDSDHVEYVVELSPRMWARVGALSRRSFELLRERAHAMATLASDTRFLDVQEEPPSGTLPRNAFAIEGQWAIYEVNPHRRSVVVLDVTETPFPRINE